MKKQWLIIIILIIMGISTSYSEELKIYQAIPIKVNKNKVVKTFLGKYHSESIHTKGNKKHFRHTGLDGTRVVIGDDGFVQIIQREKNGGTTRDALYTRIMDILENLEIKSTILADPIKWEYNDYTNLVVLVGRKLIDGKEVIDGDRIEINAMKMDGGKVSYEFSLRWYKLGTSKAVDKKKKVTHSNKGGTMNKNNNEQNTIVEESVYLYRNGWYYPALRLDRNSVMKLAE